MFEPIKLGAQYNWNDRVVEVDGIESAGAIAARDVITGERIVVPIAEICPLRTSSSRTRLDTIPQREWELAKTRSQVLSSLVAKDRVSANELSEAAKRLGKSKRQIQRYLKKFRLRQQVSTLLPGQVGRKVGARVIDERTERVVSHCIQKYYLTKERCSASYVIERIDMLCRRAGLVAPAANTIRRRIRCLDQFDVIKARHGSKASRQRFEPMPGSRKVSAPLDLVEIDHTKVDIILVTDDEFRQVLGRPILSVALDVYSRCILGFHLSLDQPSALSVALCIAHAVLPKEPWLQELGLQVPWGMYGRPRTIYTDNAAEFRGTAMARGCDELGIVIEHRPVGMPHWGGHVERVIGTLMKRVHCLPGTTFSNSREKGSEYDSEKHACMTLSEFRRWFVYEVATRYHQTPHRSLGISPTKAWVEGFKLHGSGVQETVENPLDVLVMFLPFKQRPVRRDGIEIFGMRYWHQDLFDLVGKGNQHIYFDSRDVSRVYVRGTDGAIRAVPVVKSGFVPISLLEHTLMRKVRRMRNKDPGALAILDSGILSNEDLLATAKKKTKLARIRKTKEFERLKSVQSNRPTFQPSENTGSAPDESFTPWEPLKRLPVEHWD